MAEPRRGFLGGLRSGVMRVLDKLGPTGDNYNAQTGQWSATPAQWATGVGSRVLSFVNPVLGMAARKGFDNYYNTGSAIPTGNGPLAQLLGKGTQQGLDQALGNSQSSMMAQINARNGFAMPSIQQMTLPNPGQSTGQPPAWDGSLAGPTPFGGQYGGNLGFATMPAVNARQIGGQLSFGGGHYNNGVGAGTGFGAANYANDGWGDTARGFGVGGMTGGARDQAMSVYGPTGRKTMV